MHIHLHTGVHDLFGGAEASRFVALLEHCDGHPLLLEIGCGRQPIDSATYGNDVKLLLQTKDRSTPLEQRECDSFDCLSISNLIIHDCTLE